jgi:hypothetical protein
VWTRRTANALEAELVDLVESMATATNRRLKWVGGRVRRLSKLPRLSEEMSNSRFYRRIMSNGKVLKKKKPSSSGGWYSRWFDSSVTCLATITPSTSRRIPSAKLPGFLERTLSSQNFSSRGECSSRDKKRLSLDRPPSSSRLPSFGRPSFNSISSFKNRRGTTNPLRPAPTSVMGGNHDSIYIIHHPDAIVHARKLQEGIVTQTQTKQCYVGTATGDEDMELKLERVASSAHVILLQTSMVLLHPWPLLAAFHAAVVGVPLACVSVADSGYDFDSVEYHLRHLDERLDAAELEHMSSVLSQWRPPRTIAALQSKLHSFIPPIISVVYNPDGTRNEFAATISDIQDKQRMMKTRSRARSYTFDDEEKMRRRSADAMTGLASQASGSVVV